MLRMKLAVNGGWRTGVVGLAALLAIGLSGAAAAAEPIQEGVDYQIVKSGDGLSTDGKVRVEEYFAYGCPHCHHLEAPLEAWLEENQDDVDLVRYPLPFSQNSVHPTTAFYAAQKVLEQGDGSQLLAKVHGPVFQALHEQGKNFASPEEVRVFYGQLGVDVPADAFQRIHDESAEQLTRDAYATFQTTKSRGVPTLVVDGQYVVTGKGPERTVEIIDALVQKAQKED